MFHTRNCLHRRAYQHKVCNIIETMWVADPSNSFALLHALYSLTVHSKMSSHVKNLLDMFLQDHRGFFKSRPTPSVWRYRWEDVHALHSHWWHGGLHQADRCVWRVLLAYICSASGQKTRRGQDFIPSKTICIKENLISFSVKTCNFQTCVSSDSIVKVFIDIDNPRKFC